VPTETETKLKVESLQRVERKLTELDAQFLAVQVQRDYYFDDPQGTLTKTDRCLRLRRELVGSSEKLFLTYKGAKIRDSFKKRQEVELEVKDADLAEKLLSALGYEKILAFEKKRRSWRLGECEVALDELPLLGGFVEIEGPDDQRIAGVQRSLGLGSLPHIVEPYALLIDEKLRQLDTEKREVFL
jgi:adenylate cyclase class 2